MSGNTAPKKGSDMSDSKRQSPKRAGRRRQPGQAPAFLIPDWVCSAKERRYLPCQLASTASGARKTWQLRVSETGTVTLPKELLELAGFWEGDEFQACVGYLPGGAEKSDCQGNAIVLRRLPHGLTDAELEAAARRMDREIKAERKAGTLQVFTGTLRPKARRRK